MLDGGDETDELLVEAGRLDELPEGATTRSGAPLLFCAAGETCGGALELDCGIGDEATVGCAAWIELALAGLACAEGVLPCGIAEEARGG